MSNGFLHVFFYSTLSVIVSICWCEKLNWVKGNLITILLDCKPWFFDKVLDACIIMYIIYMLYSVLWVFTLSVGGFNCFIHILHINLKIRVGQPKKEEGDFILVFNILNWKLFYNLPSLMIYKMKLLSLLWGSGRDNKYMLSVRQ